jgi:hypothetical protein
MLREAERVRQEMEPYFDHSGHDPVRVSGDILPDSDLLGIPRGILATEEYLVVADAVSEPVIHVYAREPGRHLESFGSRGFGPAEFSASPLLMRDPQHAEAFYTWDLGNRRLTRFALPSGDVKEQTSREGNRVTSLDIPTPHVVYRTLMLDEQRVVATGFFEGGRLGFFDLLEGTARFAGPVPEPNHDVPFSILQNAYLSVLASKPDGSRFAVFTQRASRIDLFDEEGRVLRVLDGPYPFPVDYRVDYGGSRPEYYAGPRNRSGYRAVAATDDRIYALFSGRAEIHSRGTEFIHAEFVHVFNWEGDLEGVLQLDRPVSDISVDPFGTTLYAVASEHEPVVVMFRLP